MTAYRERLIAGEYDAKKPKTKSAASATKPTTDSKESKSKTGGSA